MSKSTFAVGYDHNGDKHIVLGVTSIVPNRNGFLMFTEDGENHEVEADGDEEVFLTRMFITYDYGALIGNPLSILLPFVGGWHDHRSNR